MVAEDHMKRRSARIEEQNEKKRLVEEKEAAKKMAAEYAAEMEANRKLSMHDPQKVNRHGYSSFLSPYPPLPSPVLTAENAATEKSGNNQATQATQDMGLPGFSSGFGPYPPLPSPVPATLTITPSKNSSKAPSSKTRRRRPGPYDNTSKEKSKNKNTDSDSCVVSKKDAPKKRRGKVKPEELPVDPLLYDTNPAKPVDTTNHGASAPGRSDQTRPSALPGSGYPQARPQAIHPVGHGYLPPLYQRPGPGYQQSQGFGRGYPQPQTQSLYAHPQSYLSPLPTQQEHWRDNGYQQTRPQQPFTPQPPVTPRKRKTTHRTPTEPQATPRTPMKPKAAPHTPTEFQVTPHTPTKPQEAPSTVFPLPTNYGYQNYLQSLGLGSSFDISPRTPISNSPSTAGNNSSFSPANLAFSSATPNYTSPLAPVPSNKDNTNENEESNDVDNDEEKAIEPTPYSMFGNPDAMIDGVSEAGEALANLEFSIEHDEFAERERELLSKASQDWIDELVDFDDALDRMDW